ncbi:MAG TPA: hypothetical protein DEO40_02470 [Treponema sp.]|nr:hypothetical protein [Treponema sp.]HBB42834.1 hypothetical protein [Treponema sp.]HCA19525.1 hypothetical protein [Treponema sp.]
MEKRILFICESVESFLVTAMEKTLKTAGYEVVFSMPHPKEIDEMPNRPKIMMFYLDGDETKYNETLKFAAKQVAVRDSEQYVFLIGNPIDIEGAYRAINKNLVAGAFERPVNTTDLITQLDLAVSGYSIDEAQKSVEHAFVGGEDTQKKTVLIVDDDTSFLRSMQTGLSKKFNVYITNSGMNAVSFLKERPVDLILLDYEMPVLSGLEVFRILRSEQETEKTPVIFLTSKDDKNIVMKVLEGKPANYLLKPISPTILAQTVEDYFKKAEEALRLGQEAPSMMGSLEPVDDDVSSY